MIRNVLASELKIFICHKHLSSPNVSLINPNIAITLIDTHFQENKMNVINPKAVL